MPKSPIELQIIGTLVAFVVAWVASGLLDVRNQPMAVMTGASLSVIGPSLLVLFAALTIASGQRVPFGTASGLFILRLGFALLGVMLWNRFEASHRSD